MVKLKIEVLRVSHEYRQAEVLVSSRAIPEGRKWAIDILADPMPQGEELRKYITERTVGVVSDWWDLQERVKEGKLPSIKPVEDLIGKPFEVELPTSAELKEAGPSDAELGRMLIGRAELQVPATGTGAF